MTIIERYKPGTLLPSTVFNHIDGDVYEFKKKRDQCRENICAAQKAQYARTDRRVEKLAEKRHRHSKKVEAANKFNLSGHGTKRVTYKPRILGDADSI